MCVAVIVAVKVGVQTRSLHRPSLQVVLVVLSVFVSLNTEAVVDLVTCVLLVRSSPDMLVRFHVHACCC